MFDEIFQSQDELFRGDLPDSLYCTHYELHNKHPQFSTEEWRRFLRENERFIMTEVAAITEANARLALASLATGKLTSAQTTAIRQLLERSEQINSQNKDQRTFVILQHAPNFKKREEVTVEDHKVIMQQNDENVKRLYQLSDPKKLVYFEYNRNIKRNPDLTLRFVDKWRMEELDHIYLRMFNPNNEELQLPELTEEWDDVQ